jgi:outer membrane biosynthesis protein TonB
MKIFPTIFLVALVSRQAFATVSSETIREKFKNERRFTLYNSRQLEGKCLTVCEKEEESVTEDPSASPTEAPTFITSTVTSSMTSTESPTNRPTQHPTNLPTNEPTNNPTERPTKEPTNKPTERPTNKPTNEPTNKPTNKPSSEPTNKPTNNPTKRPTIKPTSKPTNKPTTKPTTSPTKSPTNQPTEGGPSYECVWPQAQYSAITKGDMINGAKNVYKKLAVGGSFKNPANSHITVNGKVYYGNTIQGRVNYNGGTQKINDLADIPVDYGHYEWLARNLKSSNIQGKKVIVKTKGKPSNTRNCWNLYDFVPGGQGEDNGNTLVVFNTSDDVCLTKTHDGRQFGPSVLAPFSKVTLTNSGFLDGIVIAKEFTTVVGYNKGTEQQLHGDVYRGQIECIEPETPPPTPQPTNAPVEAPNNDNTPATEPQQDDGVCGCETGSDADSSWRCGRHVYVCPNVEKVCSSQGRTVSEYFKLSQEQCDEMKNRSPGDKCVQIPADNYKKRDLISRVCYNNKTTGVHGMLQSQNEACKFCGDSFSPAFKSANRLLSALENSMNALGSSSD